MNRMKSKQKIYSKPKQIAAEQAVNEITEATIAKEIAASIFDTLYASFDLHNDKKREIIRLIDEHESKCMNPNYTDACCISLLNNMRSALSENGSHPLHNHSKLLLLCLTPSQAIDESLMSFNARKQQLDFFLGMKKLQVYVTLTSGNAAWKLLSTKLKDIETDNINDLYKFYQEHFSNNNYVWNCILHPYIFSDRPIDSKQFKEQSELRINLQRIQIEDFNAAIQNCRRRNLVNLHVFSDCRCCKPIETPTGAMSDRCISIDTILNRPHFNQSLMHVDDCQSQPSTSAAMIDDEATRDIMKNAIKEAFGVSRLTFSESPKSPAHAAGAAVARELMGTGTRQSRTDFSSLSTNRKLDRTTRAENR